MEIEQEMIVIRLVKDNKTQLWHSTMSREGIRIFTGQLLTYKKEALQDAIEALENYAINL